MGDCTDAAGREMSFALGRPDTLGMDDYHNRRLPPLEGEIAIIPSMVQLGGIMREVSVRVYHSTCQLRDKLDLALGIEKEIDEWVLNLPEPIRPKPSSGNLTSLRDPKWARRQRLVLQIRKCYDINFSFGQNHADSPSPGFHNVKMLLFRPFVTGSALHLRDMHDLLDSAAAKCISSAQETIRIVYETYQVHTFFQSW